MRDPATPLFLSSGDLIADRRYQYAADLLARGDAEAAADLLVQALERAENFASAWFLLGELRERTGDRAGAIAAFAQARAADPGDRCGAALRLARLGDAAPDMPENYVRALFDQYAPRFDAALTGRLSYRAPALLRDAVARACARQDRACKFASVLDLGCGTGLAGAEFRPLAERLTGVDLSPGMIAVAERKNRYDRLETADLMAFLAAEHAGAQTYDLVLAADVFAYLADLAPVARAAASVLAPGGLLAFTVETHAGDGVVLGEKLRFAHGAPHVRAALAGLALVELAAAATRTEAGAPVPGLLAVAMREQQTTSSWPRQARA